MVNVAMARKSTAYLLSIGLLAFLFLTNIYRARTQSITVDEAYTYNYFIKMPEDPAHTGPFNVNLNMLLARISTRLLPPSEFTLRLPSVLAGLLYFYALFKLCRLLFGDSPWLLLVVALNSLNPFLLDYLSAARGYGMGLAFWTLGTYYLARWVVESGELASSEATSMLLIKAGMALGLATASHIAEIFAVAALEVVFVAMFFIDRLTARDRRGAFQFLFRDAAQFCGITALFASAILWVPLQYFRTGSVDGVVDSYKNGLRSLVNAFALYKPMWGALEGPLHRLLWWLLVALLAGLAVAGAQLIGHWRRKGGLMKLKPADRVLLLLSGTSVLTFFLLWIEPQLFHHDYWAERRLLCTLPLVFTACPLWLRWWSSPLQPQRTLASIGTGLALLLVCDFALQFNVKSYFGWEIDAGTRQVASIIAERHSKEKGGPVRVGVSSVMNESLNFYRLVRHMDWMAEVPRESAECYCDYYYVPSSELDHLKRFGVEEIYRNEVAGTVLAQPGDAARKRRAALKEVGFPNIPAGSVDLTLRESWAAAGHPGVRTHMLRDIMDGRETDSQFWTFEHPAFLFDVNNRTRLRFQLHLRLPAATYKIVGPVRLTVWVNTHQLGDELYTLPEDHTFDHAVPAEWLRPDGLTVVETKLDKYFIAPDDGQKLGYLFVAGGFVN